ncbi:e1-E2 ATPase domain-containing protein [Hirsutella rhossiliensis]|uniref:E1-E2 ATPase domain-containing protein n=1 Tax=Hirsutella rhossiliensis TaxID=111463 RepID=A0A9P8SEF4_9HYPO|nr:e1-E2 ATPase domain-containing protein [Hirsutella rhossiliensis]KAH0958924.1 e1-E2 ATPase domain-containing protein [Hirsutella rhossiliensis]
MAAAGCCPSDGNQDVAHCPERAECHGHGHGPEHDACHHSPQTPCADECECCDDESCCDDALPNCSPTLTCCDSEEERCDEQCILAAAAFECEKTCENDVAGHAGTTNHEHAHDEYGNHPASACSTHLAKAFEQYSAYLQSARCICRGILERGWATTCCAEQHGRSHHHHGTKRRGREAHHEHVGTTVVFNQEGGCSDGQDAGQGHSSEKTAAVVKVGSDDVEKAAGFEHVSLAVDGMTCSGCGNKMARTLKAINGVSSARVNFVMGCAEFCHDTSVASSDQVIRAAERATGFRCIKLSSDDQTIDLLAGGHSARTLADAAIPGVTQAAILSKNVVRVSYDPTVVGARTLMQRIGTLSGGLAPPCSDPSVSSGRKRLFYQLIKTTAAACFTIPVALIAVPDFYLPAISVLVRSGALEMDMLVVISITAAYTYSVVAFGFLIAGRPLETKAFFETSTLLITLVLLGRLVAAYARIRAVAAVSLRSLQSTTAVIVEDGKDVEMDARLLQYGDTLKIGSHTVVPTDATVLSGSSEVDESMMTGESIPIFKKEGDGVIAGTINGSGALTALLTRLPGRNTVTDIARLVEEAAKSKPRLQDIADRVAGWFVPFVTSVALIVVVVWIVVGLKVRNYGVGKAISTAITYAVATLAVSCPCALGLAVPMVLVVAGGIAARNGVIIKSAQCTERARKVTDVVFDKTGTITEAVLDVTDEQLLNPDRDEAIAVSKALVAGNRHPVSLAIAKHLKQRPVPEAKLANIHVVSGAGVEAALEGKMVRAGSPEWTQTSGHPAVARLQERGMTMLVVARDAEPMAVFGLRTRLRVEAAGVVAQLGRGGIDVHLVSGDQRRAVEAVAAQVGISYAVSHCKPAEKRDYVARLMERGKTVMFVGDGTNDAVAVTQANVGVQLASVQSASDVTRGAADVVLLNGLDGIPFLLRISAVSFRRIVFNFVWSATYNLLAVLLASGAFVNVRIPPAYAGLGEIVSVLPVIFAAMTMLLKKSKTNNTWAG